MREIKFRAWDKITKKYFYSGTLDNGDILVIHLDGEIEISSDDTYKPEDFTIEQFTGLCDKNGRDIYEGDICQCQYIINTKTIEWIAEISWGEYYDDIYAIAAQCWMVGDYPVSSVAQIDTIRVLGNIHENPELLP